MHRKFDLETVTRMAATLLLGPLALIGCSSPSSTESTTSVRSSAAIDGLDRAAIDMYVGNAKVSTGEVTDGSLYDAEIDYPNSVPAPSVNLDRGGRMLQIRQAESSGPSVNRHVYRLDLSPQVGWSSYQIHGGTLEGTLDFRALRLGRLTVFGGNTNLDVNLPKPQGTVQIDVTGGSNVVAVIHVPAGVDVNVTGNGRSATIDAFGTQRRGQGGVTWQSPGYGSSPSQLGVVVTGNEVTVRLVS